MFPTVSTSVPTRWSSGKPSLRVTMKLESRKSRGTSFQVEISRKASAPTIKKNSESGGPLRWSSSSVSTV